MYNIFLLRCTLFFVRMTYFILPVVSFLVKFLFWGLISFVILLLLFLVF